MVLQVGNPLRGSAGTGDGLHHGFQRFTVSHAFNVGVKARIGSPFGVTGDGTKARKLAVVTNGQQHRAVLGFKIAVRHQARMTIALALGRLPGVQKARRLVGQNGHAHIEQTHINMLALPGAMAHLNGRQDGAKCIDASEHIGKRHAHALRCAAGRALGFAGDTHHAAHGLDHQVVTGALGVRAGLAETGYRAINQARIKRA